MKTSKSTPRARAELLIRKPPMQVYRAFVEPDTLKQFWLAKASEPLSPGATVQWDFKVKGATDHVVVEALDPGRRIRVRWSDRTITEWTFEPWGPRQTVVRIEQWGFKAKREELLPLLTETTQGYTLVLCDLKLLLEKGVRSLIVTDKARLIERQLASA